MTIARMTMTDREFQLVVRDMEAFYKLSIISIYSAAGHNLVSVRKKSRIYFVATNVPVDPVRDACFGIYATKEGGPRQTTIYSENRIWGNCMGQ